MKRLSVAICALVMAVAGIGLSHASIPRGDPFGVSLDGKTLSVAPGGSFEVGVTIDVPQGYYLNEEKLDLDLRSLEGLRIDRIALPDPVMHKGKSVYDADLTIRIEGHVPASLEPGHRELTAVLSYQGCTDEQCFRPHQRDISFDITITGQGQGERIPPSSRASSGFRELLGSSNFDHILSHGLIWTILIVFVAGLITSLTPCVWPLIPVTLVVIGVERQRSFMRNLMLSLSLVSGLIVIYALLGTVAALIGRNLGFIFQQRWFVALVAVFFIAMSLSLFGVFEIHLSRRWSHLLHKLGGAGFRGAFLSGLGLGLIASPCAGPVIVSLLAYVALSGSYAMGFVLLVVYGVGMGLLMVFIGAAYGMIAHRVRGGVWMVWMKRALGVLLLIPAAFYVGSLLNGADVKKETRVERPALTWISNLDDAVRFAKTAGRPIMIDFYADWCPPCRRLDRTLFSRDDVIELSYRLVPVRVDATRETAPIRAVLDRYRVMGLPTFIFLSPKGEEYEDLRVTVPNAARIEHHMNVAIERAQKSNGGDEEL